MFVRVGHPVSCMPACVRVKIGSEPGLGVLVRTCTSTSDIRVLLILRQVPCVRV